MLQKATGPLAGGASVGRGRARAAPPPLPYAVALQPLLAHLQTQPDEALALLAAQMLAVPSVPVSEARQVLSSAISRLDV